MNLLHLIFIVILFGVLAWAVRWTAQQFGVSATIINGMLILLFVVFLLVLVQALGLSSYFYVPLADAD